MFDSGTIKLYRKGNSASAGLMPVDAYTLQVECCYEERTVGVTRYAVGLQNDARIEMIARVPQNYEIKVDDVAVLFPYSHIDSSVYQIYQIQQLKNEDDLPCTDITLVRYEGIDADEIINN